MFSIVRFWHSAILLQCLHPGREAAVVSLVALISVIVQIITRNERGMTGL